VFKQYRTFQLIRYHTGNQKPWKMQRVVTDTYQTITRFWHSSFCRLRRAISEITCSVGKHGEEQSHGSINAIP